MAARTDATLVGGVVEVDSTIDLTPFITAANLLVNQVCLTSGYSTELLTVIETWLAAHFYAVRDVQLSAARAGSVMAAFMHKVDLGLRVTLYGQQAMLLDTAGNLAALENSQKTKTNVKVGGNFLGRDPCTPYDPLRGL